MTAQLARKRVLVCATSYADAESALTITEQLARLWGIDLGGVFVEDTGIFEAAALPSQRIVSATGALLARPDPQRLRQMMAREARAFEAALARFAQRHALSWSFEQHSGEAMRAIWQVAQGWDMLLIGHRMAGPSTGPVLLVRSGKADEADLTGLARKLAEALGTFVEDLAAPGDRPEERQALLDRINRTRAALVLTDATRGPLSDAAALRQLVEAARCPVLVAETAKPRNDQAEAG